MSKNLFITFEGADGSGKSSAIKEVCNLLLKDGEDVVLTREPGGTNNPIAEAIRNIILDNDNTMMTAKTEALLFAASRAQHVQNFIKPSLKNGKTVLCDRYIHSSLVYQGFMRKLGMNEINELNKFAIDDCWPDITFILMIDIETSNQRINNRKDVSNRLDNESIQLRQRVIDGYNELHNYLRDKGFDKRIYFIDAKQPLNQVVKDIYSKIKTL